MCLCVAEAIQADHAGAPLASFDAKTEASRLLLQDRVKEVVSADEWCVGKTKVFLKATVLPKLEKIDRELRNKSAVAIQRIVKGRKARKKFLRIRFVAQKLQAVFRGRKARHWTNKLIQDNAKLAKLNTAKDKLLVSPQCTAVPV